MKIVCLGVLTFDDGMFGGRVDAPDDDGGVERAGRDARRVGAPGGAVHARRVEAPLLVVGQLQYTSLLIYDDIINLYWTIGGDYT